MVAPVKTFVDELLAEQQRLQTPVATFAAAHDAGRARGLGPQLIPLSAPGPGEQYAFQVDLDSCSGCKACVAGCHSLNGLDEGETWRDTGLLLGGDDAHPFQQTVTTACHHCADPGCLNGCPVLAYEKDPVTGIVRHLDDQCIGCSYCVLKCPYDVPKYNERLGIVRKCDLCHGRLAAGEAPACAQACPTQAITVVTVPIAASTQFLPHAPDPVFTQPTTRYVSRRPLPSGLHAADDHAAQPQPAHLPLVALLVGTQASVGALIAGSRGLAALLGVIAIAASVLHLGQPLRAWRAFLGLRRSWLSREIVVFGAYLPLVLITLSSRAPAWVLPTAILTGLAGIVCSVMIYADTPRRDWAWPRTSLRFAGTTLVLGLATAWALSAGQSAPLALGLSFATLVLVLAETRAENDQRSRALHAGPLRFTHGLRRFLAFIGAGLLPAYALLNPATAFGCAVLAWIAVAAGEFTGRVLYFRGVDPSKMPGGPVA